MHSFLLVNDSFNCPRILGSSDFSVIYLNGERTGRRFSFEEASENRRQPASLPAAPDAP